MSARIRLVFLWLSQVGRVAADNTLRMFIVLNSAQSGEAERDAAWHLATAVYVLPFILLAPVNGALANSLPRRWVLVGSSGFCLAAVLIFGMSNGPWLACLGAAALGHAVFSPARYALLPAIAQDARMPLVRVNSVIEMGAAGAVAAGLLLGGYLHGAPLPAAWLPSAVLAVAFLNSLAVMAAVPVRFPSDVGRPESPGQSMRGFFRDARRILRDPTARGTLLGQACFLGLITAGTGALVAHNLSTSGNGSPDLLIRALILIGLGVSAGSLLAGLQKNLRRSLGLVPWTALGLILALGWAAASADPSWPCLLLGLMGGMANVPLRAVYQNAVPADARGNAMAITNTANYLAMMLFCGLMIGLAYGGVLTPAGQLGVVAFLAILTSLLAWRFLLRESIEVLADLALWAVYRVRARGPGVEHFPPRGPVLVVGNHACWFDPLFLGKILPRTITPMMTSLFFDKPGLRWLMKHVVRAIRVEWSQFRREAPEIQNAVEALDRGECVVIFPEGWLRRTEALPLRQFGRGVWQILAERPNTPVVVCWIEGGWGSYTSYFGGPPTVNKHFDWWRCIMIGLSEPHILDASILADQRATRSYLMQACLNSREFVGLKSLPLKSLREEEPAKKESREHSG